VIPAKNHSGDYAEPTVYRLHIGSAAILTPQPVYLLDFRLRGISGMSGPLTL